MHINSLVTSEEFLAKLIPSWPSFVAQILALIVLVVVVFLVAYKPVKKIISKRQDFIESNIRDAEKNKQEMIIKNQEADQVILDSKKEANRIIEEAKNTAIVERNRILLEAENEAAHKIDLTNKEIENMKVQLEEDIKKEMVNIALDASSEVLKRNVTSKDNKDIAERFIKDSKK